jgi:hypothetical protein
VLPRTGAFSLFPSLSFPFSPIFYLFPDTVHLWFTLPRLLSLLASFSPLHIPSPNLHDRQSSYRFNPRRCLSHLPHLALSLCPLSLLFRFSLPSEQISPFSSTRDPVRRTRPSPQPIYRLPCQLPLSGVPLTQLPRTCRCQFTQPVYRTVLY